MATTKRTNLSIKLEPKLKKQLLSELDALGLDVSTFVTMAAKQVIRQHGLPFAVTSRPTGFEQNNAPIDHTDERIAVDDEAQG